ncbi:MAG: D-glycero-beta-D-manno-heptose 1-phosphate adenylyltransferase [Armatimonadota bacterium]|nr:D-glycero-beta-D-manno-heptose 1-phosphate adenylyltransferase [Armatimonadota bacterium]
MNSHESASRFENTAANKIKRRSELHEIVSRLQSDGKTVVFTNGCFDIMHVGHVRYLEQARALGDCLVVGVNTDASVRIHKGDKRPIVPQFERAEVVAALACVDYVALFSEETPVEIVSELRPNIHVKGGDYTLDQMPEAKVVQDYGGQVILIPLVEGYSTTSILDRILEIAEKE